MTERELKQALIERLRSMSIPPVLDEVDARLRTYIEHVRDNCEGEKDVHNVDEVAGVCRFLRMAQAYEINPWRTKKFILMYEKLKFSGLKGRTHYRLTPIQVYMVAGIYLFHLSQEKRVVREGIIFIPRKFSKTTFLAALALNEFLLGDSNAEVHIVANAEAQAKIAYKEAKALTHQLDPEGRVVRFTASEFNFREGQERSAMVAAHTAGGKTKDGAFASLVLADEYGSAEYIKGHSTMADALNVYESSMGPRVNPLTIITTTAGKVIEGPFEQKLHSAQDAMYRELELGHDERADSDWQFVLALHPDAWEYTDEYFSLPRIHQKVNPHIGITVQSDYYEQQWKKAQGDPEVYKETVTKLFNQFVSDATRPWIQAEDVRKLQTSTRIDDLTSDEGWVCYVGMDFSQGNDFNAQSYLCFNVHKREFFADMDAWIAEDNLYNHPNARLYQRLYESGHLHICKGATIDENEVTNRIVELSEHLPIIRIGYDAYDAKRFVNALSLWIWNEGGDPKTFLRPVSQTWASYNSPTQELEYMIKCDPPLIHFSDNPLWPWEFGNCMLLINNMDNAKPVKSRENGKVDNVQCLCSAIVLYDEVMGQENK